MAATITEVSLVDRGKVVTAGSGGGTGGHIIEDASGTDMTARSNLQFKGADVSDDSTNNRTVVDMSYTEIDYEDWLELTEQEKETGRWDVVGVPGADGTVSFDLMTKLWENPNPTQAMAADTEININDTDYDLLAYVCFLTSSNNRVIPLLLAPKNKSVYACYADSTNTKQRRFDHSDGKVTLQSGYVGSAVDNTAVIPYQIYGIKTSKTVEIKAIAPEVSTSASKCMMSDGETSVEDAIEEVESKVDDVTSAAITLTGFAGSIALDRVGRICFATYLGNINSLPAGSLSFSQTLPEKFRPIHTVGFHSSATNSVKIELFFNSNGSITGYNYGSKISSTTTCTFEALSYPARNI